MNDAQTIPTTVNTVRENLKYLPFVIFATAALVVMSLFSTPSMMVAGLNYFILLAGYAIRRTLPALHRTLMTLGILSDLTLVLILEVNRHAIHTALSFKLSYPQQAHILASSISTALYLPILIFGMALSVSRHTNSRTHWIRTWHPRIGIAALIFRSLGFFLMFSMLKK